jgi:hypothetical protein
MKHLLGIIKKSFLWTYARNTWQWDMLCVLCLVFIFLTPKSWFAGSERQGAAGHPSGAVSTIIVDAELIDNDKVNSELEQRVRALTGQSKIQIVDTRKRADATGKTIAYEVDIR